eukprot:3177812-Rhodomonas_salina.1
MCEHSQCVSAGKACALAERASMSTQQRVSTHSHEHWKARELKAHAHCTPPALQDVSAERA